MNMRNFVIALFVVVFVSTIANANALTIPFSQVYDGVTLKGGERLIVVNDDVKYSHSITSTNRTASWNFDSGIIGYGGSADMGIPQIDGDYQIFDSVTGITGVIHVKTQEQTGIRLKTNTQVEAGNLITISGNGFVSPQVNVIITKPSGTVYSQLTVNPTGIGEISIPFQTSRTDENGLYTVSVIGNDGSGNAFFILRGGVTGANPLEESPIVTDAGSNSTEATQPIAGEVTTGFSSSSSSQPIDNTSPSTNVTQDDIVKADKTELLRIIAELLRIIAEQK